MKNVSTPSDECLSAMVDGELGPTELVHAVGAAVGDPHSTRQWHAYHVVGDALRSAELAAAGKDLEFLQKFECRLALEAARPSANHNAMPGTLDHGASMHSANAGTLRWKLVAGAACSALAIVVGIGQWQSGLQPHLQLSSVPAHSPSTMVSAVQPEAGTPVMIRDPELDGLLAAHQQLGGHSALQRSSGFLRNATFEVPAR